MREEVNKDMKKNSFSPANGPQTCLWGTMGRSWILLDINYINLSMPLFIFLIDLYPQSFQSFRKRPKFSTNAPSPSGVSNHSSLMPFLYFFCGGGSTSKDCNTPEDGDYLMCEERTLFLQKSVVLRFSKMSMNQTIRDMRAGACYIPLGVPST